MHPKTPTIVVCPVCDAEGLTLHHDLRATLVYSCPHCLHEWQVDPDEKPLTGNEPVAVEPLPVPAPPTKQTRKA